MYQLNCYLTHIKLFLSLCLECHFAAVNEIVGIFVLILALPLISQETEVESEVDEEKEIEEYREIHEFERDSEIEYLGKSHRI